ncbi:CHC2-type zinc finger protein [Defluviimonas denitrificans]|jgi:hypothetical protein|uniref:CHC2-type zinc finger protein n=1 Tax=Albidovulum denitrificans TaxID=404881 RepID=A0A2S8RWF5_9RHOB|nr:CHC2 zinc finger domain-containing protein [Defluviimonas denitrificans]PQV52879.1 CHC2-type zinc finger protein [Defluviimonas denitrificans]
MAYDSDYRLADAKAKPIKDVSDLLGISGLKRAGREWTGPCPGIGCGGRDRFSLNAAKNLFNCRICGAKGDQVHLVMFVRGVEFKAALDWLCGPKAELTPAERAEMDRRAEENRARQARDAAKYRADAIAAAREIWLASVPAEDTPVRDYLALRGIPRERYPALPNCLRFHPACRYMVKGQTGWREVHCGPAMIASIQAADGKGTAVHRTWIDLSQPKGKALITDPLTGEVLKSKKTLGAKKGGAIRLSGPWARSETMVMGEGIETTLSALAAGVPAGAVYWCGIDLGNISGARIMGQGKKYAGIPDMTDAEAFVPPEWVRDLILIQDGDSEPKSTHAKLLSGARRAMARRPGLSARIVPVPEGQDLNDVLMGASDA